MILGLILSIFIFASYLIWSYWKCGLKPTLSETHYCMPKWAFPIAMISCAALVLPYWLVVSGCLEFLAFLSCAGIMMVGAAPLFKTQDRKLHMGAVCMAIISALTWAFLTNWIIPSILLAIMAALIIKYKEYWILILELGMFTCIYLMLLI